MLVHLNKCFSSLFLADFVGFVTLHQKKKKHHTAHATQTSKTTEHLQNCLKYNKSMTVD